MARTSSLELTSTTAAAPLPASLTADFPLYRRTSYLVLAVGHAAAAAPPELLLPRADSLAQGALLPPAAAATTTHLQTSVAQAFALLAAAVHGPGTLAARDCSPREIGPRCSTTY